MPQKYDLYYRNDVQRFKQKEVKGVTLQTYFKLLA
jgi:hypothetical protein